MSEAFASDFASNLVWDFGRLRFPAFVLAFLTAFLEGRIRRAPRVFSRARVSESRATDERDDPELEGYLLGKGHTELLFSSVLDIWFVVVAPRRASCDRLDLTFFLLKVRSLGLADATAFYRLPCYVGRHRPVRTPRFCLPRWRLPLPLSLRRPTERAFSGHRAVLGTTSLDIPVIWSFFSPLECNKGCWRVRVRPSVVYIFRCCSINIMSCCSKRSKGGTREQQLCIQDLND